MNDQFGRTIDYMRVSVTDRCNLRCIYCMPQEGAPCLPAGQMLTYDEIARICRVGASLGIRRIRLTGGEPLMREELPKLVHRISGISGIEQIMLTTNGILLKDQINDLVSEGVTSFNISIDTLEEERYREMTRGGSLSHALEGLEAALSFPEAQVKVNVVPLSLEKGKEKQEEKDWIALAGLAKERPLEVRFIELMPLGEGREFAGTGREELMAILESAYGKAQAYGGRLGSGPADYVTFPGFRGRIGLISPLSHKFCEKCNRVRLTSEGILKPCLQYESGVNLGELLRLGGSDEELRSRFWETVYRKPACHHFTEKDCRSGYKTEEKGMSLIGG